MRNAKSHILGKRSGEEQKKRKGNIFRLENYIYVNQYMWKGIDSLW